MHLNEIPKLQPFGLSEVPSEMDWCIDQAERKQGRVLVPAPAYKLVLVLRWLLSRTHNCYDYVSQVETRQVHWRVLDEYGFRTEIWLFEPEITDYDPIDDKLFLVQPQRWVRLADIRCSNGQSKITRVGMNLTSAFGGWAEFDAEVGVNRLFMEAAHASRATHNYYPINHRPDGKMESWRCEYDGDAASTHLIFGLNVDRGDVVDLDIQFRKDRY